MGGRSRSSSSSSNQTTTNNKTTNESLNAAISGDIEEGGTAVSGKNVTITQVDPNALEFAGRTIEGVGGIITQLLENQSQTYSAATDLAGVAVANVTAASGAQPVKMSSQKLAQWLKYSLLGAGSLIVSAVVYQFIKKGK